MAICPFAVQQIIPESHTQGRITPTTLIFHRAVSSADSLLGYWTTPGVEVESHFYVGRTGIIYQFMDTSVRADANVSANGFAISVESWDGGNTPDSMGWNAEQMAANKRLAKWVCDTHGIKRAPAVTWNSGGIGGHNWFPTEWAGGPRGCPGTERTRQIRQEIIPYVAGGGTGGGGGLEDDMTPDELLNATVLIEGDVPNKGKQMPLRTIFGWSDSNFAGVRKDITDTRADIKALAAKVAAGGATIDYDALATAIAPKIADTLADKVADRIAKRMEA